MNPHAVPCRSDGRYPCEGKQRPDTVERFVAMVKAGDTNTLLDALDVVGGMHEFLAHVLAVMDCQTPEEEAAAITELHELMLKNTEALIEKESQE